jgi:hypothetical protein
MRAPPRALHCSATEVAAHAPLKLAAWLSIERPAPASRGTAASKVRV